ncbi:MAG: hydrogenase nickel incorporation protein HypB [Actinomycetota bacterium]|nr:hydrogenase nickel incorporation protein HypB [Actinomycetota bacterium]
MCATCGCGDDAGTRLTLYPDSTGWQPHDHGGGHDHDHGGGHDHDHDHGGDHDHPHDHHHIHLAGGDPAAGGTAGRTVILEQQILAKNASLAERNRQWLEDRGVVAVNLMSSPGAGKTTLLEQTIAGLPGGQPIAVIEGDQETQLDAERITTAGRPVIQVNTGAGCHLDADMIQRALEALDPEPGTLVFIENVGNLVCPALFDLGEAQRVVLASVTEGADKPSKYPHMFRNAGLVLLNKMDLLPYVTFDVDRFSSDVHQLNPAATISPITATAVDTLLPWFDWLAAAQTRRSGAPVLT